MSSRRASTALALLALCAVVLPSLSCNGPAPRPLLPRSQTWAELRTIRRAVTVRPPEEAQRAPYPRERLVDGEGISIAPEGLAWLRRDGGATLLVRGAAELTLRSDTVEIGEGRVFVDTPAGRTTEIVTPGGALHLAHVRASIEVGKAATEVYVLAGEVRAEGARAVVAGERLTMTGAGKEARATVAPVLSWDDWTGGLATTDRAAEPAPYGVGTVGARRPGEQGSPRFPLAIQRLDVRVKVDRDFAVTEVDEVFFNGSSEIVEGLYRFRTPEGAVLHRFGVDRDGAVMWGHVKEKAAAAAQYQANVYRGSTEDPALLEWDAPGVYRARLYPIGPGETRRVVVTYAEWLGRTGAKRDRRLYVYPMAAEGPDESLPRIEELYATIDLSHAGAKDVRAGMAGVREGDVLVVREHDLTPRADLAVELFDEGLPMWRGYQAPHSVDAETLAPAERVEAARRARTEAEYVLVPVVGGTEATPVPAGLDLAIVIDTSAATETAALAVARAATGALLAHLGKADRAVVWAGDAVLRPVVPGQDKLAPLDDTARRAVLAHLAAIERGGATDLGAMLAAAAQSLDPSPTRRGAVVYVGDGAPTVGELSLVDLQGRLAKLPRAVRIFGLGVGDGADMAVLGGLSRGAFAERIGDANAAARAALRLFEVAERQALVGATVDLGPNVERVFPRDLGALVEGEAQVVVGRMVGPAPTAFTVKSATGTVTVPLEVSFLEDHGDLSRRWAGGRLAQMIDEGVGRAAMVDLGSRHGIITPVTSLYVPTKNEMTAEERRDLDQRREQARSARTARATQRAEDGDQLRIKRLEAGDTEREVADEEKNEKHESKEGDIGKRGKENEGPVGKPSTPTATHPGARGPTSTATAPPADEVPGMGPGPARKIYDAPRAPEPSNGRKARAEATPEAAASAVVSAAPRGQMEPSLELMVKSPRIVAEPAPAPEDTQRVAKDDVAVARPPVVAGMNGAPAEKKPAGGGVDGDHDGIPDSYDVDLPVTTLPLLDGSNASGYVGPVTGDVGGADMGEAWGRAGLGLSGKGEGGGGRQQGFHRNGWLSRGIGLSGGTGQRPANAVMNNATVVDKIVTNQKAGAADPAGIQITVHLGDVSHSAFRCGGAAIAPFEERVTLWRERLGAVTGNAWGVAAVYRRALWGCEAPTWRERSRLLSMLLDAMPSVPGKVSLWRMMFSDMGAADALYRGMLARVRTPVELRQLHDALGLRSIDPGVLAKILKEAKTPGARVTRLRDLCAQWPDDFALALKLLDALEDAGDDPGARELGRKLRARPDVDARVRTAVGELYLRIAARAKDPAQRALDEAEARRAFGEIVEFAPDDPIARRRIGDLLRAHGWYADAARQYETLARLAPDDASVALLLAAAAEGMGKLEEAVKWTEKGGAAGAPDAELGPARTARAFAATWLSWGRLSALTAGRADEAKALAARLARVRSTERLSGGEHKGTRVVLTWAHPELHPSLWTNALGAPMPAPEGDVTLGIAAATLPARNGAFVEVRLEPDEVEHAARLGAEAVLTVVFDEGGSGETIVKTPVTFGASGPAQRRFALAGAAVKEVTP